MKHEFNIYNQAQFETRSKIPQEIKEEWLIALRSGNYKQGKNRLVNCDNEHCCLGVLCETLEISKEIKTDSEGKTTGYTFENMTVTLPNSVMRKTKLDYYGDFHGFSINGKSSLADLNDTHHSFEFIAHIIETYF